MTLPPYGLCLPCRAHRSRDGDTTEVKVFSGLVWAIREIDCWCPETNRPAQRELGLKAKHVAADAVEHADQLSVWIPGPSELADVMKRMELGDVPDVNLLKLLTFDRIPGRLFLRSDETLGELLVRTGHARSTKKELQAWLAKSGIT